MNQRVALVLGLSGLFAACSSDDNVTTNPDAPIPDAPLPDAKSPDAGPDARPVTSNCQSDLTLVARREVCEFGQGALAADTIGNCVGDAIPIEHIIILMQENRSFDEYLGHLPGHGQDDVDVAPESTSNPSPDAGAAIPWHHENAYCVEDTDHGWVASHEQWNDGANDGFAVSNATAKDATGHRALGWYDQTDIPFYYSLVSTFATSDHYFCSLLGPTFPNRMYLAAGTSFGVVTTEISTLAPPGVPQIYRALNTKGVTWKVYSSNLPSIFLFPDFANDPAQSAHLVTIGQFAIDAASGDLPQVSFLDSSFNEAANVETDEHPPADLQLGQHFVWQQVQTVINSPLWPSTAMFITYDEHGGLYDHMSPPAACVPDGTPPMLNPELGGFDRLGFRVPVTVVSPYAKRHFVSHQVHSHTSILRFIEAKFELGAFTNRDANSDAMLDLFDFAAAPRLDVPELAEPDISSTALEACRIAFP